MVLELNPQAKVETLKLCGNCAHGNYGFVIIQGRAEKVVMESVEVLLKTLNRGMDSPVIYKKVGNQIRACHVFLNARTVQAIENIVKVHEWKARCEKERVQVGIFERACSSWLPEKKLMPGATRRMNRMHERVGLKSKETYQEWLIKVGLPQLLP